MHANRLCPLCLFTMINLICFSYVGAIEPTSQPGAVPPTSPSTPQMTVVGTRTPILTMDYEDRPGFQLHKGGSMTVDGVTVKPRFEGTGSGDNNMEIVTDPTPGINHALHYFLTAQVDDHKARIEHYLHIAPMANTFVSEFSIKLDATFTKIDDKRPDGGVEWCILRQWHQSAPESPPLSLGVKRGTNNVVRWSIIFGEDKNRCKHITFGEKTFDLNHWHHIRVQWNVTPPKDISSTKTGCCIVLMSDKKLPKDLTDEDTLFRYVGPIGYSKTSGHDGDNVREQQGIYQGPHLEKDAYHGYCIDNVAIYKMTE